MMLVINKNNNVKNDNSYNCNKKRKKINKQKQKNKIRKGKKESSEDFPIYSHTKNFTRVYQF